ncbi:acetyltransferase [Klebsiella michiganensis]|uniref:Acetyltransferase n=1 Tax=Klebsiella michiganensis TaxID=1134687 RepID=A0A7H4M4B6_9ENTR|nr:acetyltransferase [Klebsiella michiganensis]
MVAGRGHWLCLVVRDRYTHAPLGLTGYQHHAPDSAEAGFLFAPRAQGKGYGYESLRALCDYAFSAGGIRRLTATVTAGNLASKNLLQKVGFHQEGELRDCYWLNGRCTTIGCLACCAAITTSLGHLANRARRAFPLHCRPTTEEAINVPNHTAAKPARAGVY